MYCWLVFIGPNNKWMAGGSGAKHVYPKWCDNNRNLQLCLPFPDGRTLLLPRPVTGTTATQQLSLLAWHIFCFAPLTNIHCSAMTMAISLCGILGLAGPTLTFKCLITDSDHSYHHTHIHTNIWLIFMPFISAWLTHSSDWQTYDLTLQLSVVATKYITPLLPNRWQ